MVVLYDFVSVTDSIHPVPPPSVPSVPILEINCFVHDDDPNHVFPVKIARTESVGTLKDAIKDKNPESFHNVDARSLNLWNVSIAHDDGFQENVGKVVREQTKLSPVDQLSDVFSGGLVRKHIHIIVKSPRVGEWKRLVGCWSTSHRPLSLQIKQQCPPLRIYF